MAKKYPRGDPATEEAQSKNQFTRGLFERDKVIMAEMFPLGYELFDLTNGEVEFVSGEEVLRCYPVRVDEQYWAIAMDDYHPEADAALEVDDLGAVQNPDHPQAELTEEEEDGFAGA